jgi:hypothetical protein
LEELINFIIKIYLRLFLVYFIYLFKLFLTNDDSNILQKIMAKEKKENKKIVNKVKRKEQISTEEPIKKKRKEEEKPAEKQKVSIGSSVAFDWNEEPEEQFENNTTKKTSRKPEINSINQDSENSSEEEEEVKKKQTQNLKKKEKKITEESIVQRENELLKKTKPETENDYERLIIESPNSSYLWIQYMSFKLYLTDVEGAREIGKRALKKINFQEDDEKFNIYSALMNLEHQYGDEKTQQKVFNDALLYCNKKRVYIQQAQIFAKSENEEV